MVASKGRRNKVTGWRVDFGDKLIHIREGSARVIYDKKFSEWQYYTVQATEVLDAYQVSPDEFIIKYTYGKQQSEYTMRGTVKGLTINWSFNDE